MRIFIVGAGGGTGNRLGRLLVAQGHAVAGLVRHADQIETLKQCGIEAALGDLVDMSVDELGAVIAGSDAVVFSAGAGELDTPSVLSAIDGRGPGKVATAAAQVGVTRFILVSVFPEAGRDGIFGQEFETYIAEKKRADIDIAARDIDWVIVRPSSLRDGPGTGRVSLGYAEMHGEIDREDVASTIAAIIAEPRVSRVILELTSGARPIAEAVAALAR